MALLNLYEQTTDVRLDNLEDSPRQIERVLTPYSGKLVTIIHDDIPASLVTTDTGGVFTINSANVSYIEYAAWKGIPISCPVVEDYVGDTGRMTAVQIRDAAWCCGTDFGISHSKSHAAEDLSLAGSARIISEITGSRDFINDIEADVTGWPAGTQESAGLYARGFVQPGVWTGGSYIDTYAKTKNVVGTAIARDYEWSLAYALRQPGFNNRHFAARQYTPVTLLTAFDNDVPDDDITVIGHGITGDAPFSDSIGHTATELKAMIDKVAAWRDAGLVHPVSASTYFAAIKSNVEWSDVINGTLEGINQLHANQYVAPASAKAALATTGGIGNSQCVSYDGTGAVTVGFQGVRVTPGRVHMLRFSAAKSTANTTRLNVWATLDDGSTGVPIYLYKRGGQTGGTFLPVTLANGSYTTFYRPFYVPLGFKGVQQFAFRCEDSQPMTIDNVSVYIA